MIKHYLLMPLYFHQIPAATLMLRSVTLWPGLFSGIARKAPRVRALAPQWVIVTADGTAASPGKLATVGGEQFFSPELQAV
jgi:hypothetical protein